jgi:hypothetical protein
MLQPVSGFRNLVLAHHTGRQAAPLFQLRAIPCQDRACNTFSRWASKRVCLLASSHWSSSLNSACFFPPPPFFPKLQGASTSTFGCPSTSRAPRSRPQGPHPRIFMFPWHRNELTLLYGEEEGEGKEEKGRLVLSSTSTYVWSTHE